MGAVSDTKRKIVRMLEQLRDMEALTAKEIDELNKQLEDIVVRDAASL